MDTIAVLWETLGPYHAARLRACVAPAADRGHRIVAIEAFGASDAYRWDPLEGDLGFERRTLLCGRSPQEVSGPVVWATVARRLSDLGPLAVAIPGWSTHEALAALAWCRWRGRVAILMNDSKWDDAPRRRATEAVKSALVRRYDGALVSGTKAREYLLRLGMDPEHIALGYDVVDNAHFATATSSCGMRRSFLAVNRFVPRKNLDLLLRAYAAFRGDPATGGWTLVLVGAGPEEPRLRAIVEAERIPDVSFPGFAQIDTLPAHLTAAGCFVHPARQEQWGLVVNEAMAAGLPVLVSRTAGCAADLVEEGINGWCFDPTDERSLAAALRRVAALSDDQRAAMGQASARIISDFTPERFAASLLGLIDSAIVRRR